MFLIITLFAIFLLTHSFSSFQSFGGGGSGGGLYNHFVLQVIW